MKVGSAEGLAQSVGSRTAFESKGVMGPRMVRQFSDQSCTETVQPESVARKQAAYAPFYRWRLAVKGYVMACPVLRIDGSKDRLSILMSVAASELWANINTLSCLFTKIVNRP